MKDKPLLNLEALGIASGWISSGAELFRVN